MMIKSSSIEIVGPIQYAKWPQEGLQIESRGCERITMIYCVIHYHTIFRSVRLLFLI